MRYKMRFESHDSINEARKGNLPIQHRREELLDQPLVVRTEFGWVDRIIALAVQVIWIELANSSENLLILLVRQVRVRTLPMPGIEAVISYHGQRCFRQRALVFEDVV